MIYKQFQDISLSRLPQLRPVYLPLPPEHCGAGGYG